MHQTPGSLRLLHFTRRALLAVTALSTALAVLPIAAGSAASPTVVFELAGTLERFPADAREALGSQLVPRFQDASSFQKATGGTMIVIPQARQLWQVYATTSPAASGVVVRDLDTLKLIRTLKFNINVVRATIDGPGGGDWAHAIDNTGTRLWLLESGARATLEIDLRTFAVTRRLLPHSMTQLNSIPPAIVGGMTYDRFEDDLLLLYGGPSSFSAANSNTFVYRLDVSRPPPATFNTDDLRTRWYRLRSCTGPVTSTDAGADTSNWEILVTKDVLYVPCQRAGHTVIVVRTPRADDVSDLQHPEDVAPGPVYGDSVLADQQSGRLFVTTIHREIWVFETATMSFVGVVATNASHAIQKTGFGLDPFTGRVYFQSATFGLGLAEGRFFPIPQARTLPRLTRGQERIWSDAVTNRVFVLEGDNVSGPLTPLGLSPSKLDHYRIYTTGKAPEPPPAPDPDRNTADVDEREGVTEVRWNASGSGYGTRILLAKGYATVPPAPTAGVVAPTTALINQLQAYCGFTDRDVFAGRVAKAEYDTGSTAAEAIAIRVDSATEQDLNQPSRCNLDKDGRRFDQADRWAYKAASCASSEGNVPDKPTHGTPTDLGPSEVRCPAPGGKLTALAETDIKGIVRVDRSWTETTVERPTGGGVRSTVTAVAQGVSIADTMHIGEIRATAVSSSNGRGQRKDMSTHAIKISEVRIGGETVCQTTCDPVVLEERLNAAAGNRALFRTGQGRNSGRDEALLAGSPRGAQTAVQKSVARQASDRALVGDFTVEVPAFEITVFNDNPDAAGWGRARQIYQFAGVASSATYNIILPPTFGPLGDGGLPDDVAVAETGNTPFSALVQQVDGRGTDGDSNSAFPVSPAVDAADDDSEAGGLVGAVKALARGIRLFFSDPRHALLLLTAWALLGSPAVLSRRRRLLAGIRGG